jgi:hypothetical protein
MDGFYTRAAAEEESLSDRMDQQKSRPAILLRGESIILVKGSILQLCRKIRRADLIGYNYAGNKKHSGLCEYKALFRLKKTNVARMMYNFCNLMVLDDHSMDVL